MAVDDETCLPEPGPTIEANASIDRLVAADFADIPDDAKWWSQWADAVRQPSKGPEGVRVNRTAEEANVVALADRCADHPRRAAVPSSRRRWHGAQTLRPRPRPSLTSSSVDHGREVTVIAVPMIYRATGSRQQGPALQDFSTNLAVLLAILGGATLGAYAIRGCSRSIGGRSTAARRSTQVPDERVSGKSAAVAVQLVIDVAAGVGIRKRSTGVRPPVGGLPSKAWLAPR